MPLISSFSALAGFGGAPLLSIRMGEGIDNAVRQVPANSFTMLAVLGVVLTLPSFLLKDRLLMWFGASGATFPYADRYISIYLGGTDTGRGLLFAIVYGIIFPSANRQIGIVEKEKKK